VQPQVVEEVPDGDIRLLGGAQRHALADFDLAVDFFECFLKLRDGEQVGPQRWHRRRGGIGRLLHHENIIEGPDPLDPARPFGSQFPGPGAARLGGIHSQPRHLARLGMVNADAPAPAVARVLEIKVAVFVAARGVGVEGLMALENLLRLFLARRHQPFVDEEQDSAQQQAHPEVGQRQAP